MLGIPQKPAPKPYKPQLTPTSVLSTTTSPKGLDIIDILSDSNQKPPVCNSSPPSTPSQLNRISVTVNKADEARGMVFLDRVKAYLEAEPEKLFVSRSEGVKNSKVSEIL